MLISEPEHAAALRTQTGETYVFDDPGCLFRHVARTGPRVSHLWFHDETGWLRESEAGFLPGGETPMGSGMVTVNLAVPGAISVGKASNQVLSR